jgi:hypothetical protein
MHTRCPQLITLLLLLTPFSAAAQESRDATAPTNQPSTVTGRNNSSAADIGGWLASGFVGSNFGNNANPASMDFGGTLTYLRHNRYGAEVNVGITPDFQLQNNFFGYGNRPQVNSYMINAIWARPLGSSNQVVQPYISGGIGAISLRTELANSTTTFNEMKTRFGANIGGGAIMMLGPLGFRAGLEYYRATGAYNTAYVAPTASSTSSSSPPAPNPSPNPSPSPSPNPSPTPGPYVSPAMSSTPAQPVVINGLDAATAGTLTGSALSGLHYWRGNAGLVVRW